jgi:hypothetical protein
VYVYRVIKDPENYKKDPPLVIKAKKEWFTPLIQMLLKYLSHF